MATGLCPGWAAHLRRPGHDWASTQKSFRLVRRGSLTSSLTVAQVHFSVRLLGRHNQKCLTMDRAPLHGPVLNTHTYLCRRIAYLQSYVSDLRGACIFVSACLRVATLACRRNSEVIDPALRGKRAKLAGAIFLLFTPVGTPPFEAAGRLLDS